MPSTDLNGAERDALARLERRARAKGRSVAEEINVLLAAVDKPAPLLANTPVSDTISAIVADVGITEKDWQYFNRSLEDIRFSRSDSIKDEPIFGDWYDDFEDNDIAPAK